MKHIPMSMRELLGVLDDIRTRVAAGDSFEGSIEYLMAGPFADSCPACRGAGAAAVDSFGKHGTCAAGCTRGLTGPFASADFAVLASYRVGNTDGQGSCRMLGTFDETTGDTRGVS